MVTPDITTRTCTLCGVTYPLTNTYFQPRWQSPSGFLWRCRNCMKEIRREYRSRPDVRARSIKHKRKFNHKRQGELQAKRDASAYPSNEGRDAERWVVVQNYELYEVSDRGRVRRIKATAKYPMGLMLSASKHSNGYVRVTMSSNGKRHWIWVHRLVAQAFLGDPPSPEHQVNHKDGNPSNNHVANLEYVTPSENKLHATRVLKRERTHISEATRYAIWKEYKTGAITKAELSQKYGIPWMVIHNAINRYERIIGEVDAKGEKE